MTEDTASSSLVVKEPMFMAWDPGSARTGYALFKVGTMKPLTMGILRGDPKGVSKFLMALTSPQRLKYFIIEDFTLRPTWNGGHQSSSKETIEIVGMLKMYAGMHDIEVVMQEPWCKDTGASYSGTGKQYVGRNKHMPDDLSAMNHGVFYQVKNKLVEDPARQRLREFNARNNA